MVGEEGRCSSLDKLEREQSEPTGHTVVVPSARRPPLQQVYHSVVPVSQTEQKSLTSANNEQEKVDQLLAVGQLRWYSDSSEAAWLRTAAPSQKL